MNPKLPILSIDINDTKVYRNEKGQYHRLDGPAIEYTNGRKAWYVNGIRHRLDGAAIEYSDGHKEWWVDGSRLTEQEFNLMYMARINE